MEFKIGDTVEVHNPEDGYEEYRGRIGIVGKKLVDTLITVTFSAIADDWDYFHSDEIQIAKNHIVINILNDL